MNIGFFLVPGFALMSLSSAIEPLRAANHLAGKALYRLDYHAAAPGFVASSSGGGFHCAALSEAQPDLDLLFVVAGGDPIAEVDPGTASALRRLGRRGVMLGGISGGAAMLAHAGLMEGRRFTLHWLHLEELQERRPGLLIERALYVIDRDRYSCAGGVASFDMMCAMVAAREGADFAAEVSNWFIHSRMRTAGEPQHLDPARRYNLSVPALELAVRLMTTHIADPLSAAQLAALSGCSARQLQRHFVQHFGLSTMAFYRNLRLDKAHEFLRHSALPMHEIAQLSGFSTVPHFSRCFAQRFGTPPAAARRGAGQA
jgi:transcriptional regulator GlxA family with amidase domain